MPIIPPHLQEGTQRRKRDDFMPLCNWPDDCTVQWGGRGVVLSDKGSYGTAFFEAFPSGKGFFRGEGVSIEEAERACFEKYAKFSTCDHAWGRGFKIEKRGVKRKRGLERPKLRGKAVYTNGGAICRKCNAFASMLKPVIRLGAWKDEPSVQDLVFAAEGHLRPVAGGWENASIQRSIRRTELRLRAAGVALPPTPPEADEDDIFGPPDAYVLACRKAVVDWHQDHRERFEVDPSSPIASMFMTLDHHALERLVEEEMKARAADDEVDMTSELS